MLQKQETSESVRVGPVVALDLMRGAAAIVVFLGHVRNASFVEFGALPPEQQGLVAKIFFGLTRLGHEAVLVFFVLSGFLVGGQLIRRAREKRLKLEDYVIERATRILVPLIPACILAAALELIAFKTYPSWLTVILNMFGLNGVLVQTLPLNPPLWSLAYEIWFYIIAGAVAHLFVGRRGSGLAVMVFAIAACVFCQLEARYLLFWCLGAFSVLLLDTQRPGRLALVGAVCAAIGVVTYQLAAQSKSFANITVFTPAVSEALICIGIALIIPLVCDRAVNRALHFLERPSRYLSSLSYTLYLVHFPVCAALTVLFPRAADLSWGAIGIFCLKSILIWVSVIVFYFAFEAQTLRLRRYLKKRLLF